MTTVNCIFKVVDNSGATAAKLIGVYKKKRMNVQLGDIVKVSIVGSSSKKIPEGSKRLAIVCCLKSNKSRNSGIYKIRGGIHVKSEVNGVAILAEDGKKWSGTGIKGYVADEIREKFPLILSKAEGVF